MTRSAGEQSSFFCPVGCHFTPTMDPNEKFFFSFLFLLNVIDVNYVVCARRAQTYYNYVDDDQRAN